MQTWDIAALDVKPYQPQVIESDKEGRVVVIQLPAGEQLSEHQVHERAWLLVVDGRVQVSDAAGRQVGGGSGLMAAFDPNERHEVRAEEDSRLLLMLAPWPGAGHPSEAG